MSSYNPKLNKSTLPKSNASTNRALSPSASKVDDRSAAEFSELLKRRGGQEAGFENKREIQASLDKSHDNGRVQAQLDKAAAVSTNSVPSVFFQEFDPGRHNIIEDNTHDKSPITGGLPPSSGMVDMPAVFVQKGNLHPAVEQVLEAVFRNWRTQLASAGGQHWSIQLTTGADTTSELAIEYTATGEWRLKISGEAKSSGSDASEDDSEAALSEEWDHRQFCIELEACLKENRPDINFSAPRHS